MLVVYKQKCPSCKKKIIVILSGTLERSPQFDCGRLLVRVRSHPVRGVVTWGLPQCLFVLCTLVNQSLSLSQLLSLLHHTPLLSQYISQWTAVSGRGRDAPSCEEGRGGVRNLAELWWPQEVIPLAWAFHSFSMGLKLLLYSGKTNNIFRKQETLNKKYIFQEMHYRLLRSVGTLTHTKFQREFKMTRDFCPKWLVCNSLLAVVWISTLQLHLSFSFSLVLLPQLCTALSR